jgi:hypothetical protein
MGQRLLRLEPLSLPESGLDSKTKGTLMHDALASLYRAIAARDLVISDDATARDSALSAIDSSAVRDHFDQAQEWYRFISDVTWDAEKAILLSQLRGLVSADFSNENPAHGLAPHKRVGLWHEYGFGNDGDSVPDVQIDLGDGQSIRLRGRFDRVDIQFSGETLADSEHLSLVLIDYKTGSSEYSKRDMAAGLKLQMPLYVRAAQVLIDTGHVHTDINARFGTRFTPDQISVAGGVFWGIARNQDLGSLSPDMTYTPKGGDSVDIIPAALETVARYVQAIRAGDFRASAHSPSDGKCVSYCDFADLCRICATIGRRKPN